MGRSQPSARHRHRRCHRPGGRRLEELGWYVIERDGFHKPNRFAYGPDDYRLQIEAAYPEGYPPTLSGVSPCFPGDVPKERRPFPKVLRGE